MVAANRVSPPQTVAATSWRGTDVASSEEGHRRTSEGGSSHRAERSVYGFSTPQYVIGRSCGMICSTILILRFYLSFASISLHRARSARCERTCSHGSTCMAALAYLAALLRDKRQLVDSHPAVHYHREDHPHSDVALVPEELDRHGAAYARLESPENEVLRRPRDDRRGAEQALQGAALPPDALPDSACCADHHPVRPGRRYPYNHRRRRAGH